MNNPKTTPPAFTSVYANDPSNLVAEAFAELYPDAKYEAILAPSIVDPNGQIVVSCITFPNEQDGSDTVPVIAINSQVGVEVAAEALGKELIHVALGPDSLDGGEEYDKALAALKAKYEESATSRFPEEEPEPNGGGGNGEQ